MLANSNRVCRGRRIGVIWWWCQLHRLQSLFLKDPTRSPPHDYRRPSRFWIWLVLKLPQPMERHLNSASFLITTLPWSQRVQGPRESSQSIYQDEHKHQGVNTSQKRSDDHKIECKIAERCSRIRWLIIAYFNNFAYIQPNPNFKLRSKEASITCQQPSLIRRFRN
jgi:hypothetical protein